MNKNLNLAPIVLFVYNRLEHTIQTIEALKKNYLANESEIFIYSDAAKNNDSQVKVNQVREFIKTINGFKKITIIEQKNNLGLARSIMDGVTSIVNRYGKIIVLEDDLLTSPYFLKFMNESLEYYKNEKKVWHISGWNYPYTFDVDDEMYFWRVMDCWGWATWSDRWSFFQKDTDFLINTFTKEDIYKFNIDGCDNLWNQVILNKKEKINTWAIFWYATIFRNNGLCLNPIKSFVRNIGLDGSGEHCINNGDIDNLELNMNKNIIFIHIIKENKIILEKIKYNYKLNKRTLLTRIINKLSRIIIKRNIIK